MLAIFFPLTARPLQGCNTCRAIEDRMCRSLVFRLFQGQDDLSNKEPVPNRLRAGRYGRVDWRAGNRSRQRLCCRRKIRRHHPWVASQGGSMTYPITELEGMTPSSPQNSNHWHSHHGNAAGNRPHGQRPQGAGSQDRDQRTAIAGMGEFLRLHADSRDGQGQGRAGPCRRPRHGTRARAAQSGAAAQNMKEVNTRRKLVRMLPSEKSVEQMIAAGPQASAQDHYTD